MRLSKDDFSQEAFAAGDEDSPPECPLTFPVILREQDADNALVDPLDVPTKPSVSGRLTNKATSLST